MGWAIPYAAWYSLDSEDAVDLAEELMGFIQSESRAHLRSWPRQGVFPTGRKQARKSLRVRTLLQQQSPYRTISIIASVFRIEPVFSLAFTRHVLDGLASRSQPGVSVFGVGYGFDSDDLMDDAAKRGALTVWRACLRKSRGYSSQPMK